MPRSALAATLLLVAASAAAGEATTEPSSRPRGHPAAGLASVYRAVDARPEAPGEARQESVLEIVPYGEDEAYVRATTTWANYHRCDLFGIFHVESGSLVHRGRTFAGEACSFNLPVLDAERGVMMAPMRAGLRLTTGAEFAHRDAPPSPVQIGQAEISARDLVPLGEPVEAQAWMGARPVTPDMLPIIGPAPRHDGLWFAFGHAHHGLTLGPATGALVAQMMAGETPPVDPFPYRAERFRGAA